MMPAANSAGHLRGRAEAHRPQGLQRFRIVLDAGEDQIAMHIGKIGLALEQAGIMILNRFHGAGEIGGEIAPTSS